ncbi:zf-HC2 domain-containing protein [Ideonella azotifigens]|uniref:Putative zinc-finger domain-containing protein n=1 Tax=Ideonella azotifigens TaxID=513160 RepID=A0ABN1JQC2_9BURK|nr:zf-HC2 domain-containing protein [Ideonella azotifigens]MCD2340168.1 zf-HC2 domain-containing protein [Ideonella azotifigens]
MKVVPLDPGGHADVLVLLPWYLGGSLDAVERAQIDAHLAGCARCRAALAEERQLAALQAESASPTGNVNQGLAALRQQLAANPPRRPQATRGRWAAWGSLAAVLAGVAVLPVLWQHETEPSYRGLGSAGVAANAVVKFRADTTEAQIRAALSDSGAKLVGGPTATQLYLLALPVANAEALARLRQLPGVTLAESLDAGGAP